MSKSISSAIDAKGLHEVNVLHAGEETFPLAKKVRAVAAGRLVEDL